MNTNIEPSVCKNCVGYGDFSICCDCEYNPTPDDDDNWHKHCDSDGNVLMVTAENMKTAYDWVHIHNDDTIHLSKTNHQSDHDNGINHQHAHDTIDALEYGYELMWGRDCYENEGAE